ncbi:FecR family protein [Novosphingobium sp. BL-52-GroH]|uniref:FecR family protein n=1 Tax=Novosphingobium sp. BL-52-GroH TaxID=3349877 RepID=UPI00384DFAA7
MTETQNPFQKGQLRLEATDWFVLMRGPDAEQHRVAFEQWLGRGALHRAAYNRVAQLYSAGKQVNWDTLPEPRRVRGAMMRTKFAALTCVAVVGFIGWRILPVSVDLPEKASPPVVLATPKPATAYRTGPGEMQNVRLADGSGLTLDGNTLLIVTYGAGQRTLRLEYGRARFQVAHEKRPFVVEAGSSKVIARGTVFDVSFEQSGSTRVQLLKGVVDVISRHAGNPLDPVRLKPGERVSFRDQSPPGPVLKATPAEGNWALGLTEFNAEPLAKILAQANRTAPLRIVLTDPSLGETRVSGAFRLDDPEKLAQSLGMLLDLQVRKEGNTITLAVERK